MATMRLDSTQTLRAAATALGVAAGLFALFMGYCVLHGVVGAEPVEVGTSARWGLAATLSWSALLLLGWRWRHRLRAAAAGPPRARIALLVLGTLPILAADAVSMQLSAVLNEHWSRALLLPRLYQFAPRAAMLSAILLLALLLWERRLAAARPQPAPADDWLDFPEAPLLRLRAADVALIRSAGNYSEIVCPARTFLVRATLSELADRLAPRGFVRVHRQTVINAAHVREIARDADGRATIRLAQDVAVPVGRRYRCAIDALTRGVG